jgi:glutathione synthase/RimK-type ligase-like ATP-grasp enzyme
MSKDVRSILLVRRLYRRRWFWTVKNAVKDLVQKAPAPRPVLDDRHQLDVAERVLIPWPNHCAKPAVGLVKDYAAPPYWTKYERFLRNNEFPFKYYDIHRSDWLAASEEFDVIIWASTGSAPEIEEHKRKTFTLETYCKKVCFPSFETLMWYEDKIYQYEWLRMNDLPVVETFVSHSLPEIAERIPQSLYPMVTKVPVGAGSQGVELVKNARQAEAIARRAFSPVGRTTYWPYLRHKDYVYFQKFLPNAGYDMRVIAVGNRVFGYYRDVPQREFRASGMGLVRKAAIPEDAMQLARHLMRKLDLDVVAVDMLRI